MRPPRLSRFQLAALAICLIGLSGSAFAQHFNQVNLVSNVPGAAAVTDPNLVNPWGISFSPTSPLWIADNGTGVSTLYNGDGTPVSLVVTIPPPSGGAGPSKPTGTVFNGGADFVVTANSLSGPARFLFVTEDGTIAGWNPTVDLHNAVIAVDNSALGAIYKGLASGATDKGTFLYATNFHDGVIEMYDTNFQLVKTFTDEHLPEGYAPFGISNIEGKLYVTFAKQDEDKEDDVAGRGFGFVDVFNLHGRRLHRLISRGRLNAPWGLARAPEHYGKFSHALLVGNFGDGRIHAYNLHSGKFRGTLRDPKGHAIWIDGLWALAFGNGTATAPTDALYFTAGPNDEADGLFGYLARTKH